MTEAAPKKSRSGTENRKKSIPVTTRYDEAELAELDEAASKVGLTRASYQRVQSLAKPKTRSVRRPPLEKALLAKLLGQLGKVGSNLNQITARAHLDRADRAEIMGAVIEVRATAAALMEALGRAP